MSGNMQIRNSDYRRRKAEYLNSLLQGFVYSGELIDVAMASWHNSIELEEAKQILKIRFHDQRPELVDGKIPAHMVCPYRRECPYAAGELGSCGHQGISHAVPYSCGTARMFKIFKGE